MFIVRLRSYKDLESSIEELSAIEDKKTLLEMYKIATQDPYGFLFVQMVARSKRYVLHQFRP